MKKIIDIAKTNGLYMFSAMTIFLLITGCGGSGESSSRSGAVKFTITTENAEVTMTSSATGSTEPESLPFFAVRSAQARVFPQNCDVDYYSIEAVVYNETGNQIASGGPWPCSTHRGSITGISAGKSRKIEVYASDKAGKRMYFGEKNGLEIISEQTTDAGYIRLKPLSDSGYIEMSDGANIYYETKGTGEPLILIHGGEQTLDSWDPQVAELYKNYEVIRYDMRHFGKSDAYGPNPLDTWEWSDTEHRATTDLMEVIGYMNLNKAHICGISLGSAVAAQFAAFYPEMVDKLVLAGPLTGATFPVDDQVRMNALNEAEGKTIVVLGVADVVGRDYVKGMTLAGYNPTTVSIYEADIYCNVDQPQEFNEVLDEWLKMERVVVNFPDPNFEAAIREELGKPDGVIFSTDLFPLKSIEHAYPLNDEIITNIEGIQYCIRLKSLDLSSHNITDISPISN
ncbi:alpha/beta fold hydrolase, partial [Desulfobacterales bacterium HSG16]|nr:alpha/beta fold hydrolase [Desulfobacterales bacterium HSG16]